MSSRVRVRRAWTVADTETIPEGVPDESPGWSAGTRRPNARTTRANVGRDSVTDDPKVQSEAVRSRGIRNWETLEAGEIQKRGIFGFQQVVRRSPRTGRPGRYQVLHLDDWVNVVAITEDDDVVLIEQYRHGIDRPTLEIPGGLVEPGEDPAHAAERELLEETGYAGEPAELLGRVHPNPAFQTNVCSTYLVRGARRVAEPDLDPGEDIAVAIHPRSTLDAMVRRGDISHSLVVAAFHWLNLAEAKGLER